MGDMCQQDAVVLTVCIGACYFPMMLLHVYCIVCVCAVLSCVDDRNTCCHGDDIWDVMGGHLC